jgi:hypothetical protein
MSVTLSDYQKVNKFLIASHIDSILYGSLGVSIYLGNFKDFGDIDLLVDDKYLLNDWPVLVDIMSQNNFDLIDLREHEFENKDGIMVAFAKKSVLSRDKICDPVKDVQVIEANGIPVTTLDAKSFINAYVFSSTDGYRIEKRGKNDLDIVEKLTNLLNK